MGYRFKVQYCNLTKNSWMYQIVSILEAGHIRKPDGTRGAFTYERILIGEIFRVDDHGCTIVPDRHMSLRLYGNPPRQPDADSATQSVCLLCDYQVIRKAWQYDNVQVHAPPGALESGDNPLPRSIQRSFSDDPGYHLTEYIREGKGCLLDGADLRFSRGWGLAHSQRAVAGWSTYFTWAIPCAPPPASPPSPGPSGAPPGPPLPPPIIPPPTTPPPRPLQPEHGSKSGVPTFSSSDDFDIGGKDAPRVRPGPSGWTRDEGGPRGESGEGRRPVPR